MSGIKGALREWQRVICYHAHFAETKHKLKRENLHGKRKYGSQLDALLVNVVGILENQMSMIQKKKQSNHGIGGLIMTESKIEQSELITGEAVIISD